MFLLVTDVIWELAETFYENHRTLIQVVMTIMFSHFLFLSEEKHLCQTLPWTHDQMHFDDDGDSLSMPDFT